MSDARATESGEGGGPESVIAYANLAFAADRPKQDRLVLGFEGVALVLSSLTGVVLVMNDEPYTGTVRYVDAFVQLGLSCVLAVGWVGWSAGLVWLRRRGRVRRAAMFALLWVWLMLWILWLCAGGYVSDLIHFQTPHVP